MADTRQQHLFDTKPDEWEFAADDDRLIAEVVLNRPMATVYHYLVPDRLRIQLAPGQRMRVPFGQGNRSVVAYCVGLVHPGSQGQASPPSAKLKSIEEIIDKRPLLSPLMLELTKWIAERYLCSWGQVLDSIIPAGVKKSAGTRLVRYFRVTDRSALAAAEQTLPPKQQAVLEACLSAASEASATEGELTAEAIMQRAGCGPGPLRALVDNGLLTTRQRRQRNEQTEQTPVERVADLQLNGNQQQALEAIVTLLRKREHETVLLHGVTGSGKTEVYIQAIREIVSYGRQAIVLVPEISLTPQTISRFRCRFDSVAVLHSHLSDVDRHDQWRRIASGEVQVVVGARSAVFAPTPHLGLIVIDEEHETSFKQETTPRYHAREVARQRARMEKIPLILGSATPILESWYRVARGLDKLISLPSRIASRPLPPVGILDIRQDPFCAKGAALGRALFQAIQQALLDGGQVMLFLNLRGYSPAVWCRVCGETVKCPRCSITLNWHKDRDKAVCHLCDFEITAPSNCPGCGHAGLKFVGIGTQRLEHEVRARFPQANCIRMDSDSMRKPGSHERALDGFRDGKYQMLLGTQMIAKGLDFPNVTLVGVINADTMLHQPDLRAAERTFQLIAQVAGRTGRGERGGRVLVQTTAPGEPAIVRAAEHVFIHFAETELKHRAEAEAPPFYSWTRIIFRGRQEEAVKDYASQIAVLLRETASKNEPDIAIRGPAPAPIGKLKDYFRFHILLSAADGEDIRQLFRSVEPLCP